MHILKSHGESGDAEISAAKNAPPMIKERIDAYERKTYGTQTSVKFSTKWRRSTLAVDRPEGRKNVRDKISALSAANADGSEKFPLMFIGTSLKPCAFKVKTT